MERNGWILGDKRIRETGGGKRNRGHKSDILDESVSPQSVVVNSCSVDL